MLKVILASAAIVLLVPHRAVSSESSSAIAQDSLCFMVSSTHQITNLTPLCNLENGAELAPIVVSNLRLDVPDQAFLSSSVKATVTNRSSRPIQVEVVRLQVNRADERVTIVPIFMNQTLNPGESVPASGLFDKAELREQNPSGLSLSFQNWQ